MDLSSSSNLFLALVPQVYTSPLDNNININSFPNLKSDIYKELSFVLSLFIILFKFIKIISEVLLINSISCPKLAIVVLSSNKIPLIFIPALINFILLSFIFSS